MEAMDLFVALQLLFRSGTQTQMFNKTLTAYNALFAWSSRVPKKKYFPGFKQ